MKNKNERGFFDEQFRLEKLTCQNDPLVRILLNCSQLIS